MARFNLYEQQTSAQSPRASGAEFGAAPAQALEGAGNALADIGYRIQQREELGAAQNLMENVDTWAVTALDDFQKRQDIMGQQALPEFQNALQQKRQEVLGQFTGSSESRARLERQLDNQLAQYGKSAITAKIKAGHDQMGRALDQQFNKTTMQVDTAPDIWSFAKDENLAAVEMWKPAMSKEQYEQAKRLAHAKPLQAAVRSHLAQGNIEAAEKLMTDESFSKFLTVDEARPLRIDAAVGRGKMEQEERRVQSNIGKFRMRLGRELTPDEVARIRTLPAKKDMTPSDEITELELIQGKPASQDQVDKIFKTYTDDGAAKGGMFGNSLQGRALSFVTENAPAYANRMLPPEQMRQFEAAFNEAYGTKTIIDSTTGLPRTITPTVPGFVQEALSRGGAAPLVQPSTWGRENRGATGEPRPGDTVRLDINGQPMGQGVVDASGKWTVPAPPEAAPTSGESPVKGRGLWSMADKVAGPVAGVKRAVGGGPVPLFGGEEVSAAQYVDNQQKSLVRALQQNPRYAEGERKSIEKDIAISPETFGNPMAYRLRLIEIGKYIDEELKFNAKVLQNPTNTTVQQRQQAMQSNAALSQFFDQLELPPKVKSIEEAKKLPPTTEEFLDENWILRDGPARKRK